MGSDTTTKGEQKTLLAENKAQEKDWTHRKRARRFSIQEPIPTALAFLEGNAHTNLYEAPALKRSSNRITWAS